MRDWPEVRYLPVREWFELGQALTDLHPLPPKYFRADQTAQVLIGEGCKLKADGKTYGPGQYRLGRDIYQNNNFGRLD